MARRLKGALAALACVVALVLAFAPAVPNGAAPATNAVHRADFASLQGPGTDAAPDSTGNQVGPTAAGEGRAAWDEEATASEDAATAAARAPYEPGAVLVTLSEGVTPAEALSALQEQTGLADLSVEEVAGDLVKVSFSAEGSVEDAVRLVEASPVADAAQPNFAYYPVEGVAAPEAGAGAGESVAQPAAAAEAGDGAIATASTAASATASAGRALGAAELQLYSINDPVSLKHDWHLRPFTWGGGVDAYGAWSYLSGLSANQRHAVTVAVIDVGFNLNHEDLTGNYVEDPATGKAVAAIVDPYNAYLNKAGAASITTGGGDHGTHVAGIIAAHANNGKGVAGVAGNYARVMPIQAFDDKGQVTYTSTLVKAMDYVLAKASADNVRVVNMSLGCGCANAAWSGNDRLMLAQVAKAHDRGIVTVVASCNVDAGDNTKLNDAAPFYCYPGDFAQCVTVMALQPGATLSAAPVLSDSSNYNRPGQMTKDIAAPGADIWSSVASSTAYDAKSGTSMATPVVSAVMALMFSAAPGLDADEAASKLYSTAMDLGAAGWDAKTGYGEVNASRAVAPAAYLSGPTAIASGKSVAFRMVLPEGASADGARVTWSIGASTSSGVATLTGSSATAQLTGKKFGAVQVRASATVGGTTYAASQTVSVFAVELTGDSSLHVGEQEIYCVGAEPLSAGVWKWATSNSSIASIDSKGLLTAKKPGKVTVTATLASDSNVKASKVVTVMAIPLKDAAVSGVSKRAYTGKAVAVQKPTVKLGSTKLKAGTDYKISYRNAKGKTIAASKVKAAGTYYVVITGKGNYSGALKKSFKVIAPKATYRTRVVGRGWTPWKANGAAAGLVRFTTKLQGLQVKASSLPYSGTIRYKAHVLKRGWSAWAKSGAKVATSGSRRLDVVRIQLTGAMAKKYNVYYRVHSQKFGWMGWAKNGAKAGAEGYAKGIDAVRVKIVPKGLPAPGPTTRPYRHR